MQVKSLQHDAVGVWMALASHCSPKSMNLLLQKEIATVCSEVAQ